MGLKLYYHKKVTIITYENKLFVGFVGDYIATEDNNTGLESIILDTNDGLYEFNENDIKEINIMQD